MQSLISLTFDDGLRCQFEQALPILNRHRLPATFFLVANTDSALKDGHRHPRWRKTDWGKNDIQIIKKMIREGHEIGSHSVHHKLPFLDDDPEFEARQSKRWIEDRTGVEVSSYCYPFCHFTDPIKMAVSNAGYKQARWGANDSYYSPNDPIDQLKIDCRLIGKSNFKRVRGNFVGTHGAEDVDSWVRPGCWHVLMFHGIGTLRDGWWAIPVTEFARQMTELVRHRDSGSVAVVTFEEGARRLSQGGQL